MFSKIGRAKSVCHFPPIDPIYLTQGSCLFFLTTICPRPLAGWCAYFLHSPGNCNDAAESQRGRFLDATGDGRWAMGDGRWAMGERRQRRDGDGDATATATQGDGSACRGAPAHSPDQAPSSAPAPSVRARVSARATAGRHRCLPPVRLTTWRGAGGAWTGRSLPPLAAGNAPWLRCRRGTCSFTTVLLFLPPLDGTDTAFFVTEGKMQRV